jgi:hypothetical protein
MVYYKLLRCFGQNEVKCCAISYFNCFSSRLGKRSLETPPLLWQSSPLSLYFLYSVASFCSFVYQAGVRFSLHLVRVILLWLINRINLMQLSMCFSTMCTTTHFIWVNPYRMRSLPQMVTLLTYVRLESRAGHRPSLLRFFVVFLSHNHLTLGPAATLYTFPTYYPSS